MQQHRDEDKQRGDYARYPVSGRAPSILGGKVCLGERPAEKGKNKQPGIVNPYIYTRYPEKFE
jgi:hypothetical protein